MAWLPDSTLFVTDGYANTRVVKFDADGNFLLAWGEPGNPPNDTRPSRFNAVHGIAIDPIRAASTSPTARPAHPGLQRERRVICTSS